jgi:hypothetical protein
MEFEYHDVMDSIDPINQFLKEKRQSGNFSVIDIGAALSPWFRENCDVLFDYISPRQSYNCQFIRGDITTNDGWKEVLEYVDENGKFDYAICKQTIEDIHNPDFVCDMLTKISKSGWIGVPSKYVEMRRGRYPKIPQTVGLCHHRWIFITKNDRLYMLPKMGWTDSMPESSFKFLGKYSKGQRIELGIHWEDSIELKHVLPFTAGFPDDYLDDFLSDCIQGTDHPMELWTNLLNESD